VTTQYGLTANGFTRKRLIDVKTSVEGKFQTAFGHDINLESTSVFGLIIGIVSEAVADQWEAQENVYNSQYPVTAQGASLSNVVTINGLKRNVQRKSTVTLILIGIDNTVIPAGSQVASTNNDIFITLDGATIVGGSASVSAESQEYGAISASAGTIITILDAVYGWTGVTNAFDAVVGRLEETDSTLRERRDESVSAAGNNLENSLEGQLKNISGVFDAAVISNGTDAIVDGVPANRFECTVSGGEDADIAEAIWNNTPQGILSFGSVETTHRDSEGNLQNIEYTRPTEIPIYIQVKIWTDSEFPVGGQNTIKDNIVAYCSETFKIGDDVLISKLYTEINYPVGLERTDILIGTAYPAASPAPVVIGATEIPTFSTSNVEVLIQ
jgi:uncharacterized phage protein gp47/JayE